MQTSNQLLKPVIILAIGFALGLGAANYFAAVDNEGEATATAPPPAETANTPEAHVLPAAPDAPGTQAAKPAATTKDSVDVKALSEDISMSESVDAGRQETAATEPSPEELLANHPPMDRAATSRLSPQETDDLERKLRLESENTASVPIEGNEGLLGHERL